MGIIKHYKELEPKLRKTRLAALITFLDGGKHSVEGAEDTIKQFRQQMMKDTDVYTEEQKNQEKTDKQKDGWMSFFSRNSNCRCYYLQEIEANLKNVLNGQTEA